MAEEQKSRPRHAARQRKTAKKGKALKIAAAIIAACAAGVSVYVWNEHKKVKDLLAEEGIYQGISIGGVPVAGLSEEEAVALLQPDYTTEIGNQILTLQYSDAPDGEEHKWEIPFAEIGAGYDVEAAVKAAYEFGRTGEEKERFAIGKELMKNGKEFEVEYTCEPEMLQNKLTAIAEEFDRPAKDSELTRSNGKFSITQEQKGYAMNQEATKAAVAAVLDTRTSGTVEVVADIIEPKITAEANSHVTDRIGTYTTTFNNSDPNRNNNLVVGCRYINGTVIAPGGVFSANAELGSQTAAGGYKNAGVYVNGKVEQGMAGGVCQITSTVYNAVILAELEIVERSPHSMTVGYVPLGRDAAIAGTYKDLKFRNNTDYPIYVEAYAGGGQLVVNIYGHEVHNAGRKVEFETVYEETIPKPAEVITEDPEKPEGTREITSKGRTGCKVSVNKIVYENGKQISSGRFSSSSYRAAADYVTVGTKKPEAAPAAETAPATDVGGIQ